MTLSITTFSIMVLLKMCLSRMTLSITKLSRMTLSIIKLTKETQQNDTTHSWIQHNAALSATTLSLMTISITG
jgi:hypothetical protein